jgi:hypothetical protein
MTPREETAIRDSIAILDEINPAWVSDLENRETTRLALDYVIGDLRRLLPPDPPPVPESLTPMQVLDLENSGETLGYLIDESPYHIGCAWRRLGLMTSHINADMIAKGRTTRITQRSSGTSCVICREPMDGRKGS